MVSFARFFLILKKHEMLDLIEIYSDYSCRLPRDRMKVTAFIRSKELLKILLGLYEGLSFFRWCIIYIPKRWFMSSVLRLRIVFYWSFAQSLKIDLLFL